MQSVWVEETVVKTYQADFQQQWKPSAFFQVMQEAASNHAASLGFGYDEMLANNLLWILSRVKVRFESFPRLGDQVIVRTWPKGVQQRVFFMRDFVMQNPDGRRYATATSAWILIDPVARHLLPPRALKTPFPDNDGLSAMDDILEKINPPEGMPEHHRVYAGYSAVDMVGHVNNTHYIDWVSDCFPMDDYRRKLDWLQINYLNEVHPGENVALHCDGGAGQGNESLVLGVNLDTNLRAFEVATGWARPGG
ncbi:MAG: hypothetical protein GYA17_01390 [Chloroflexi bacterium]|nr:thioesterase [Anaerolineaceae bacterium]NMB86979.1 hypothetical protein [Chloroflexota bacterium]